MATLTKFHDFTNQLGRGTHNFASHTFKVMLTNTAPLTSNTVKTNITEITAANGYTAGGLATTCTFTTSSGTAKAVMSDVTWTATGGSFGPFRYVVVYNDTSASDNLVGFYDYGSSITLNNTEPFTVDFDLTNGMFTIL